jgi:hypothetical protein
MSDYKSRIYAARRNPALMQQIAFGELSRQLEGKGEYDIPDGSIPFVACMEFSTLGQTMAITELEAQMRMLNPRMALTQEEIYYHMSSDDYIGRFCTPASDVFDLYLSYDDIVAKAVPYGNQGMRKLVIPRLTQFNGGEISFTMQYPIELRVLRHGGLQIVYDDSDPSPVEVLRTNMVTWDPLMIQRNKVARLKIPVQQFVIKTATDALSPSTLFEHEYSFPDQFYFARVYLKNDTTAGKWSEIKTTHSDQSYNPTEVTAVLKVLSEKLQVSIPTIYTNTGMAVGQIRVDIYTSKGAIDVSMADINANQFSATFNAIDDDITYVSPLNTFSIKQVLSVNRVTGGSNEMSLLDLRNQVIDNTVGEQSLPITDVQVQARVERRGYTLVSNIDQLTERQFLASKRLGTPQSLNIISGAGVAMSQLRLSMDQISKSAHVADNGPRITILPSMIYSWNNGKVQMMTDTEITTLNGLDPETLARTMNESRYVYTPFHYVMDATDNNFDLRPYYLDNPRITEKTYVGENDTSNMQATLNSWDIARIPEGYRVRVRIEASKNFQALDDSQVMCQIGYKPTGENVYASVNGELIGMEDGNRVYQFDILTNYDIDSTNEMYTTNMSIFSDAQHNFKTSLLNDLDVSILVVNSVTPGYRPNDIDAMVQSHLLPRQWMLVARERLETTFGYDMTRLWRRNRPVIGEESYKRWEENIQKVYLQNVYKTDEMGNVIIDIGPNGEVITYLLHAKGELCTNPDGSPIWKHEKGDPVRDENGKLVLVEPRKLLREVVLLMVDAIFNFATEEQAVKYKTEIPMEFVQWIQSDINELNAELMEKAMIYVYPTQTYGDTVVLVRDGQETTIPIDQSFSVSYWLQPAEYSNSTIRPSMTESTKVTIDTMLERKTVSRSDITTQLTEASGSGVLGSDLQGLGGPANYPILTVVDDAVRLSFRKKMELLANQELTVVDDLTVNFLPHKGTP